MTTLTLAGPASRPDIDMELAAACETNRGGDAAGRVCFVLVVNRADFVMAEADPAALPLKHTVVGPASAPPVLVLHGITASHRYWLPRIRPLARSYRLIIPDLPGFGSSPKPVVEYRPDFFVKALRGLLDRLGLRDSPCPIIAHSLGGLLALELAARWPERCLGLVLMSIPRFPDDESAHEMMLRGSASYRRLLTVDSVAATWGQMRRTGFGLTLRTVQRLPLGALLDARRFTFRSLSSTVEHCLMRHRIDPVLERWPSQVPLRLIHGENDQAAPFATVRDLPQRPPHPELQVIAGAGHHPIHTHTKACLRLLNSSLSELHRRT